MIASHQKRRHLLGKALAAAIVLGPTAAHAQPKAMPVIGYLSATAHAPFVANEAAFRRGLGETGYVEGRTVAFDYRWADGDHTRLPAMAAALVNGGVDLIVASGGPAPALAAQRATSTIPIVFTAVGDAVGVGLVASLARPGANITGMSILLQDLAPKHLELLCELIPAARRIALLVSPTNATHRGVAKDVEAAAAPKGVELSIFLAGNNAEIDIAFGSLADRGAQALIVAPDAFFTSNRAQLIALAARYAIPVIHSFREYADDGGLISYGPSNSAAFHQAGIYAGRILKGEKPANLPVQQPTAFELVINTKTAKTLGFAVPSALLARANEVIE